MNGSKIMCIIMLCVVYSAAEEVGQSAFFRISTPSNSIITDFDPFSGTLSCSNTLAGVTNQIQKAYELTGNSNWVDFVQLISTSSVITERILDLASPEDMAFIPGGNFQMGDHFFEGVPSELPVHNVYVHGFYMEKHEVTKTLWDEVYNWAINHGYTFDNIGFGKANNHPVHTVSWYDAIKWCNARSEQEGRVPCYTNEGGVYRSAQAAPDCDWTANGYRLPTEAEWEKAARGGLNGKRFPWGNTIQHNAANYFSSTFYDYNTSTTDGYHPVYNDGAYPTTNPTGVFSPNGYGLYNTAGNISEWCWDWYNGPYHGDSPSTNPKGAPLGSYRARRGGSWSHHATYCRLASRLGFVPSDAHGSVGFRVCLSTEP